MKGWTFIQTHKGRLTHQGVVVDQVADGLYLCHFQMGDKSHAEVVEAQTMTAWHLFPDEEERSRFMQSMAQEQIDAQTKAAEAEAEARRLAEEGDGGGDPPEDPPAKKDGPDIPEAPQPPESANENDSDTPDGETEDE